MVFIWPQASMLPSGLNAKLLRPRTGNFHGLPDKSPATSQTYTSSPSVLPTATVLPSVLKAMGQVLLPDPVSADAGGPGWYQLVCGRDATRLITLSVTSVVDW